MIGCAIGCHRCEEIITQAKLLRICPVIWDVRLGILRLCYQWKLVHGTAVHGSIDSRAGVVVITTWRIALAWKPDTISTGKSPKKIIKGMIFHHHEDSMCNRGR